MEAKVYVGEEWGIYECGDMQGYNIQSCPAQPWLPGVEGPLDIYNALYTCTVMN